MIIKPTYTTESIEKHNIEEYDMMILESLVSRYGSDIMFQSINESHSYYGTGGRFDRTGGSRVGGISGMLRSIPSLAITTLICWPAVLLAGLGALSHRIREKYEDKNSWLNRLNPRFWVDYLATSHKGKSSSSSDKNKEGWFKRLSKSVLGGAAGAGDVAGATALIKDSSTADSSIDPNEAKNIAMNAIFVPYWITLSNGEILRVRADSEENAKTMANMIIAYTTKPCYNKLNEKINQGCPKYKFYFDDGEMCYWSAPTQRQAYNEALNTRKELCDAMNEVMTSSVVLDTLEEPKVDGKVEVIRGEKIEVPQQNKFLNVTTVQPKRPEEPSLKPLPKPTYKYGSFSPYKVGYANFILNIPGYNSGEPAEIAKDFNSRTARDQIRDIYYKMDKHYDLYKVKMKDGDIYVIPGKGINEVSKIAVELYYAKVESIKTILQDAALEEYEDFLTDFGDRINSVKDVKLIDPAEGKDYTIKKGDEASLVKITDKEEKNKRYPNFKL
jgi:hypothetical protein